jgi:hypothetical protein
MPLRRIEPILRQRTQRSVATRLYATKIETKKRVPISGWARQREAWGEDDPNKRGCVSPLGGTVRAK